ncbi:MAG: class C beta-lactamase-related serine hydrolase [Bradyrhizobium sp.]|uniref:serine hydrolase domain-containing protein n=1 Tax=Bradyrhizobium sp. TaxID=376 RepID=UPI0012220F04|nr:serine hydrolase [Bradyrhizobium sp.]THD59017.1 MAG: class C beta-lactamase-related serine hydrolase [Bradyrhizobium sp.]
MAPTISRRAALAGLAATAACGPAIAETIDDGAVTGNGAGPTFSPTGPNADLYGAAEGFPAPSSLRARLHGNPFEPNYRVGAFSHFGEIYTTRKIERAATPWMFKRSLAELRYSYKGKPSSLTEYLSRNPVTGLLIAKDDRILFEHYQYGRTDRDRMLSQSMVKSITGILIGIAVSEGAIKSVDDTPETYVPGFKGTEYGRTPIRDLLHMSSGVDFGEERDDSRDLNRLWGDMIRGSWFSQKGTVASIAQFNHRIAAPGTRYYYASIEPDVLGVVLHNAVNKSASDYLQEKVWQPIGAEADASWFLDAEGFEVAHFGFNAVLRDYARLGRLLAYDGAWEGKEIIPAQWMLEATTVRPSDSYLLPGKAMPDFGYGYFLFLLPGKRRQFAFSGDLGQRVCVDPASKLVMVQTALETRPEVWRLWSAVVEQFG